jgi:hypothetical protein
MNAEEANETAIELKDLETKAEEKEDSDEEPKETPHDEEEEQDEASDDMDAEIFAMENQDTDDEGEIDPTPQVPVHRRRV